ncbi:MAG: sigma-70 family RNA polymerase sigma factor [Labedaea sp.]
MTQTLASHTSSTTQTIPTQSTQSTHSSQTVTAVAAGAVTHGFDADAAIEANLPLVGHLVREVLARVPAHIRREDLFSAGSEALVTAGRNFDPTRGIPFTAFAAMRVRGALLDELRNLDWAPRSLRGKVRRLDTARDQFIAQHGRVPTDTELATTLEVNPLEVAATRDDVQRSIVMSLQGLAGDSTTGSTGEIAIPETRRSPEDTLLERERIGYLHAAINALPQRLRTVITGYYFHSRPMAELATELNVTESRISQLRAEATALLRDGLNAHLNPDLIPTPTNPDGCAARRRATYYAAIATHTLHTHLTHTTTDATPLNHAA